MLVTAIVGTVLLSQGKINHYTERAGESEFLQPKRQKKKEI